MNLEIKQIVDKLTPQQQRQRMLMIELLLANADELGKIADESGAKVQRLEQELKDARAEHSANWQAYMEALRDSPHPCCI